MKRMKATISILGVFILALLVAEIVVAADDVSTESYEVTIDSIAAINDSRTKSYIISSAMQEISDEDLQFKEFARYVENALDMKGYIRVNEKEKAEILIRLAYGIGNPQTTTYTTTTAPGYAYPIGWWWQVVPPTVETSKQTTYHRHLILEAFDLKTPGRLPQLWKTTVQSDGASSDIRIVLPYLITVAADYFGTNTGSKLSTQISSFDPRIDDIMFGSGGVTKTEGPSFGIAGWSVPDSIAPYVGRGKKGVGFVVERIFRNTLARKMGLQKGDIILEVNKKTIKEGEDIKKEIQSLKPGEKVTIRYWRSGPGEVVKTGYLE